jgi:hypothetical protein
MTEKERVAEHLNTLSILYYIYAALLALGMCFGGLYVAIGAIAATAIKAEPKAPPGAEMVGGIFAIIGTILILVALTGAVCCFLSARYLKQRRNRTFSQVVAALCCLHVPLGTALGVFTFIALAKPETVELYAEAETGGAPPAA